MKKSFLIFGSFSAAIAVALGALGAHFLKSKLSEGLITENNLQAFETAVKYQMYHAVALLVLVLLTETAQNKLFIKSGYCFIIGTILFSGSIYLLSTAGLTGISNVKLLGPVTPLGGLFFIAGWVLLGVDALKLKKAEN
jgi:uncharacterized membrane protein YgdD (TMEM256/DUF423 family)